MTALTDITDLTIIFIRIILSKKTHDENVKMLNVNFKNIGSDGYDRNECSLSSFCSFWTHDDMFRYVILH
jgi:hypothetical protein